MKDGRKESGCGFTLIELLVVIAVIAILASFLLPSLSRSKLRADTAACRNNLRQQSMGLAMYVNDFAAYPRYCTGNQIVPGKFWMQLLEGYVGGKWPNDNKDAARTPGHGVFACPGYNRIQGVYYHAGDSKGMFGGTGAYAYNAIDGVIAPDPFGFGGGPINVPPGWYPQPIKEVEVVNPSRMISIGDCSIVPPEPDGPDQMGVPCAPWFWHLAQAMFSTGLPQAYQSLTLQDQGMLKRHGGRWNEVFCDGHVENGSLEDFFNYKKDEVLKLWNRDNQAHHAGLPLN